MLVPSQAPVVAAYVNGGYEVSLHVDGTKVRIERDASIPPVHPEQMDLKITDWCDAGCAWCHERSTRRGKHGDVDAMIGLLNDLPAGVEIAIGGGDPLSHPEFERLVAGLRETGLVPSVTVNGRHLARHRSMLDRLIARGHLFGVGVSFASTMPDWDYEHMVVHVIAGVDSPSILDDQPRRKLLVLGYKNFGRGEGFRRKFTTSVEAGLSSWFRELPWIAAEHHLSFDTLAVQQLRPERLFRSRDLYERRHMGAEGTFSMYVDGVEQEFSISSYDGDRAGWTDIRSMFADVRSRSTGIERDMAGSMVA